MMEVLKRWEQTWIWADLQLIGRNIGLCDFTDRAIVFRQDLARGLGFLTKKLPEEGFALVFVDPPYRKGLSEKILAELAVADVLAPRALVVIEDDSGVTLPHRVGELTLEDHRHYGDTGFWFYRFK